MPAPDSAPEPRATSGVAATGRSPLAPAAVAVADSPGTDRPTPEPDHNATLPAPRTTRRSSSPLGFLRRHALLLLLVLVGAALRLAAISGFRPALLAEESARWLGTSTSLRPGSDALDGYPLVLLAPLARLTDSLLAVAVVQHLLGLATGILVYAVLRRWAVWRWLAALAAVPALLDGYVVTGEHLVVPDTLFVFALTAAIAVLGWQARPGIARAVVGGLLLGLATTVRLPAELTVAVAVGFLLLVAGRQRLAAALAALVGFAVPVLAATAWQYGGLADAGWPGRTGGDPATSASVPGKSDAGTVADALLSWSRDDVAGSAAWDLDRLPAAGDLAPRIDQPAADLLAGYAGAGYLPGLVLLAGLVLGVSAVAGLGRASPSHLRGVTALVLAVPAAVVLDSALADVAVGWRDLLPAVVLWPAAGALGLTALLRGRRAASVNRPQIDEVDRAALREFRDRYGDVALAPVCVVIAAYNEAPGLPTVLSTMPTSVCGLPTDVVVVDDGSSDGTAQAAREAGRGYLVACPENRGQGAALRLGYRVARDFGARYIITTDADGQYDVGDFPAVLQPLLDGEADFVTGSRRLGHQHTRDRFRRAGVYVFAWIVSAFTGRSVTDTSFGLRAMRAEVTGAVTLNQPQYQSSELLLGVHSHGYRIAEVPATMHVRSAGTTKKGRNLVYGTRYARVVFGTWWREGCPSPVADTAPALRRLRSSSVGGRRTRRAANGAADSRVTDPAEPTP